jgi:ribose 5-phosphate isomerase A
MNELSLLKLQAARKAVEFIKPGMVVGLGSGSTAAFAIEHLAELLQRGQLKNIVAIPSSLQTEALARTLQIPLTTFDVHPQIDITIDGADEVDADLNLIKGGGGALLREKVLAQASRENIIIVDESKLSQHLGEKWPLPIEVIPFARPAVENYLASLGANVHLRRKENGLPFQTDQGNLVLDANFGAIGQPQDLAEVLNRRAGIVEHGLFLGLASRVIVAGKNGIDILEK